jgi:hypothetical protein
MYLLKHAKFNTHWEDLNVPSLISFCVLDESKNRAYINNTFRLAEVEGMKYYYAYVSH